MYRTILVPLDGSALAETALAHLPHVAGPAAEVLLLRVIEPVAEAVSLATPSYPGGAIAPIPPLPPDPQAAAVAAAKTFEEAEGYLNRIAASIRSQVGRTRTLVLRDADPATVIADQAQAEAADLILMATHGRSGVVRWVLGSVADRVLHSTHRPLLLVRPGQPAE